MSLPWSKKIEEPKEKIWITDYSFFMYNGSFAYRRKCKCLEESSTKVPDLNCSKCNGTGYLYMQSKDGHPTGGLFTVFSQIIEKAKQGFKVITVFDPPKDQLNRMKLLDTYKGGRPPVPDWITFQMDYGQKLLPYTGVQCYYSDQHESDDVMATIALEYANKGHYVVVASDDKDMFPLLAHPKIDLYRQREIFNSMSFHEHLSKKEGIQIKDPGRFNEFLAICGDSADNFNLLNGLGPKAAEWIIANTGNCIQIFDKLNTVPFKYMKKLINCSNASDKKCTNKTCIGCRYMESTKKQDMQLSLNIATLVYDAEYRNINRPINKELVKEMLEALNLTSAVNNIDYLF
jgi:5'-3' exonuclease